MCYQHVKQCLVQLLPMLHHCRERESHILPLELVLLDRGSGEDGLVVSADGQVVVVVLTQLYHQSVVLQLQLLAWTQHNYMCTLARRMV